MGQLLDEIPRSEFEKLVKSNNSEYRAKGFKSWTQFVSMLFAQISGQKGLRSIEAGMNNQKSSWYHCSISPTDTKLLRSTLSYANKNRSATLYEKVFELILKKAQELPESHGFRFKNPLYSIDSSTIDLCYTLFPWADFRKRKSGIKLTVKLDHQGKIPSFVSLSTARKNDSKLIQRVPVDSGDVIVFDRGYNNYDYFHQINKKKAYFVTRMKSNAVYTAEKERTVKSDSHILQDEEICLTSYPGENRLRRIVSVDSESGKGITLLTNNLEWSSRTIARIYKERWQIELFFKAIKQSLKIKRFYGNSQNAVLTQIWIALIVYLLYYLIKMKARVVRFSFSMLMSILPTVLFQHRPLYDWISGTSPPIIPDSFGQMELEFL